MKWLLSLLAIALFLPACSSTNKIDDSTPQGAYALAKSYEKQERYRDAIREFTNLKDKHPYSSYAVRAALKIADIQYKRENYIEAQNDYQLFKDFHPTYPRIAYVTYRLAMSYFQQLPSTIDRDLSLSKKALIFFNEVINSYPTSHYVADCKAKRTKILTMLAHKELYVAHFYREQDQCDSALGRYQYLLKHYPNSPFQAAALEGAAYCADKDKQPEQAKAFFAELKTAFPKSKELRRADKELKSYEKQ